MRSVSVIVGFGEHSTERSVVNGQVQIVNLFNSIFNLFDKFIAGREASTVRRLDGKIHDNGICGTFLLEGMRDYIHMSRGHSKFSSQLGTSLRYRDSSLDSITHICFIILRRILSSNPSMALLPLLLLLILSSFVHCYKQQEGEDRHDDRAVSSNIELDETNPYEEDERLLRVLHHVGGFTEIRNTWRK